MLLLELELGLMQTQTAQPGRHCPQHSLLCHLGLYKYEFEFEFGRD